MLARKTRRAGQCAADLVFPVEHVRRELDFRIALGCLAAARGHRVIVGQHDLLFELCLKGSGGIYVGKNVFRHPSPDNRNAERFRKLHERGIKIIYLDEEGGVFVGDRPEEWENALRRRCDPSLLGRGDVFCAWGTFQAEFYRSTWPAQADQIRVTGHPRFDLGKGFFRRFYHDDVQALRQSDGQSLLVVSNAAVAHPLLGFTDLFSERHGYDPQSHHGRYRGLGGWAHASRTRTAVVELVSMLAEKFPGYRIIIRPHPSENDSIYHHAFGEVTNVVVRRGGNFIPACLAARATVHTGSTTGIEGVLAGANVISFRPFPTSDWEPFPARTFGIQCQTVDEVVSSILNFDYGRPVDNAYIDSPGPIPPAEVFANLTSYSFSSVLDAISEVADNTVGSLPPPWKLSQASQAVDLKASFKRPARALVRPRQRGYHAAVTRFPGFQGPELQDRILRAAVVLGVDVRFRFHGSQVFEILPPA